MASFEGYSEAVTQELQRIHLMKRVYNGFIWIIFAMMALSLFVLGPRIESTVYPIVPEFIVDESWKIDDRYFIKGHMVKTRPECEPTTVSVWAGGGVTDPLAKLISVDFRPDPYHNGDGLRSRPAGAQAWGPWEIFPPEEPIGPIITITSRHRCHVLWQVPSKIFTGSSELFFPDKLLDDGDMQ